MDWSQLRSFYFIATLGSISRAAEAVYRSQSALSQQLKALETHLRCPLFRRIGKQKMVLTEEGQQLFAFAKDVFLRHRQLVEDLENTRLKRKGVLRLAAGTATLSLMLPPVVSSFSTRHPDVNITLYDKSPEQALSMLANGQVDIAVALASSVPASLTVHPWLTGHFSLMLPTGHPLTCLTEPVSLEHMARYPIIKLASNTRFASTDRLEKALYDQGLSMRVFMEAGNIYLMAEYVRRGFGISMVVTPESGLDLFAGLVTFVPLDHLFSPEAILVCTREKSAPTSLPHAFLECLEMPL